jgi:hypothetical protein
MSTSAVNLQNTAAGFRHLSLSIELQMMQYLIDDNVIKNSIIEGQRINRRLVKTDTFSGAFLRAFCTGMVKHFCV